MMDAMLYMAEVAFVIASFGFVDLLERTGWLSKLFTERYKNVGGVILFIVIQVIPAFLPDIVTIIIAVAMTAGYIGYRIGHSKR